MKVLALFVLTVLLVPLSLQGGTPQFNLVEERTFEGNARFLCAADLDYNGTAEILVFNGVTREAVCYDFRGSPLWSVEVEYPLVTGAAEDVDDNGKKEIFLLEDLGHETFYSYRITRVDADGTSNWRKYVEMNVPSNCTFHFINADGNPGKEIVFANRVMVEDGRERLDFEWDRFVINTETFGDVPYFLVYAPDQSLYELYTFDIEPLWQGKSCDMVTGGIEPSMQMLLCTMFIESGVCSCLEDWSLTSVPPMKSVRLWGDLAGDGSEEAVFFTDSTVQLFDSQGNVLSTWESPERIEKLQVTNLAQDSCSEIIVLTPQKAHLPSMYVLDCTGALQSVYALNLSGAWTVLLSDLDGDQDVDVLTFDEKKKSSLCIYSNTSRRGPLDELPPMKALKPVDPASFTVRFWTFYLQHSFLILAVLLGIVTVSGIITMKKLRKPH